MNCRPGHAKTFFLKTFVYRGKVVLLRGFSQTVECIINNHFKCLNKTEL